MIQKAPILSQSYDGSFGARRTRRGKIYLLPYQLLSHWFRGQTLWAVYVRHTPVPTQSSHQSLNVDGFATLKQIWYLPIIVCYLQHQRMYSNLSNVVVVQLAVKTFVHVSKGAFHVHLCANAVMMSVWMFSGEIILSVKLWIIILTDDIICIKILS